MHLRQRLLWAVLTLGLPMIPVGCGSGNAKIRLINAYPSQPNLDMLIDGNAVASSVTYGSASGYSSVSSGSRHLQVEAAGTSNIFSDQTISLGSGSSSSVLSTNSGSTVLTDTNSTPSSGNISIRVINAASTLGTVDIYIVPAGSNIVTLSPSFSGVTFPSATNYTTLTAGSYQVIFTLPGQKFGIATSSSLSFSSGQVRTVVGLAGQTGGFTIGVLSDLN